MPKVTASNNLRCYIAGEFIGCASEIELPEIEMEMVEYESLGLYGTPEFPAGIQAMEATITWMSFDPLWAKAAADFTTAVNMQFRGSVEEYETVGRIAEVPLVITMRALFKKNPIGSFSKNEFGEFESELSPLYIKQSYGGETVLEFDAIANIYKVGGRDLLNSLLKV